MVQHHWLSTPYLQNIHFQLLSETGTKELSFTACGINEEDNNPYITSAFKMLNFPLHSYWLDMKCADTDLRICMGSLGTCPCMFYMR